MRKILIVDDELAILDAFTRAFQHEYAVTCTSDGTEALRLIRETGPELIILDWRLQGDLEGKDVLLFSKKEYPRIPVYVLTASTHLEKEIRALGADECLRKPCQDLKKIIHTALPPS